MDLSWWLVAIMACVALAAVIVAALRPSSPDAQQWRPLANVERLTTLPAYVRAARRRTVRIVVGLTLLAFAFACAAVVAARPTGLPSTGLDAQVGQPEDVMVCAGAPPDDPAVAAALRYFAGYATTLDSQRIGLTSTNRRVIPMTRDHQFAAQRFGEFASGAAGFAPAVRYVDYAESVDDVLALCLTGFPGVPDGEDLGAQRRSVVYVGPSEPRAPGESRPALFDTAGLSALAEGAEVQVNVLATGPGDDELRQLAGATGGLAFDAQSDVAARLAEIRANAPPPTEQHESAVRAAAADTPDVPVLLGLLAVVGLSLAGVVVRR